MNGKLRILFLLHSFNSSKRIQTNLCEILNNGKSKKFALIAVSNKLLKQSFAIAKSGLPYDETHLSVLSK